MEKLGPGLQPGKGNRRLAAAAVALSAEMNIADIVVAFLAVGHSIAVLLAAVPIDSYRTLLEASAFAVAAASAALT